MPLPSLQGDDSYFVSLLKKVFPGGWVAAVTPVGDALLTGFADMLAWCWAMLVYVQTQARVATATGNFLDAASFDFNGSMLPRFVNEADTAFRVRIQQNFFAPKNTRAAVTLAVTQLTGRAPQIFEPTNAGDTGGWDVGGIGFDVAGGWGDTNLPFQFFVIAHHKLGGGIANAAGWDTSAGGWDAGGIEWTDQSLVQGQVTDAAIQAAINTAKPSATIAWMRIT